MIFFVGNDGTIIKSEPSPVYQGSANANDVYLIAPFAWNLAVTVAFQLPNGIVTKPQPMAAKGEIEGVINKATGSPYKGWSYELPSEITQYYGKVTAQFYFYNATGKIAATSSTSFTVGRGVAAELPDTPDQTIYEEILAAIAGLQSDLNNGWYAARSIYAWNSEYTYGANEIVYYAAGVYGKMVRSKKADNRSEPYDADGNLSADWWEVIDFDEIYALAQKAAAVLTDATAQAEKAAQSAQQASASATNANSSATRAASSATQAQGSADSARQSANAAALSANELKQLYEGLLDGNIAVNKATNDGAGNNIADQFSQVASDIDGIREDIKNEAHFRGYVATNAEVQALPGTPNDYAYSAESGTVWIYQMATGWTDSGKPVPDQMTPASNTTPLMDGVASVGTENAYARGDHRHPSDTSKANTTGTYPNFTAGKVQNALTLLVDGEPYTFNGSAPVQIVINNSPAALTDEEIDEIWNTAPTDDGTKINMEE